MLHQFQFNIRCSLFITMALWQMDEVIEFINSYRQLECLWNYKSEEYKRQDVTKGAWLQLSKEFGRSVAELKKKIKHLRTAYVVEKKKVDKRKKSLSSAERAYQPHLFYYDYLTFLDPFIVLRRSSADFLDETECATEFVETADNSLTDSGSIEEATLQRSGKRKVSSLPQPSPRSQTSQIPSPTPSSVPGGHKRRALESNNKDDKFDNAVEAILNFAKGEDDNVYAPFTKSIAIQLQQLTPLEASEAMGEIQQLVTRKMIQSMQAKRCKSLSSSSSSVANGTGERQQRKAQNTLRSLGRDDTPAEDNQNQCCCGDVEIKNEFELHTKSWASDLRKMSSVQRIYAKREIAEVIYQGQLGSLNPESNRKNRLQKGSYMEKEIENCEIVEMQKDNPEYIIS